MAFTTWVKNWINRMLRGVNLKVDSLTMERAERQRLHGSGGAKAPEEGT